MKIEVLPDADAVAQKAAAIIAAEAASGRGARAASSWRSAAATRRG